jgi:hypothetical protein
MSLSNSSFVTVLSPTTATAPSGTSRAPESPPQAETAKTAISASRSSVMLRRM